MVMATGILSIGFSLLGIPGLGTGLFVLNVGIYAALVALSVLRIAWFASDFLGDVSDHRRAPGLFAAVWGGLPAVHPALLYLPGRLRLVPRVRGFYSPCDDVASKTAYAPTLIFIKRSPARSWHVFKTERKD
jgi:hypothetical protein